MCVCAGGVAGGGGGVAGGQKRVDYSGGSAALALTPD